MDSIGNIIAVISISVFIIILSCHCDAQQQRPRLSIVQNGTAAESFQLPSGKLVRIPGLQDRLNSAMKNYTQRHPTLQGRSASGMFASRGTAVTGPGQISSLPTIQ